MSHTDDSAFDHAGARNVARIGHTVRMSAGVAKLVWMTSGVIALGLGVIGIFVPLLPTVPFVLLAAFCFSRGNRRWEQWMLAHPKLGPIIVQWRTHRVVPLKAKLLATTMMTISCVGAWMKMPSPYRWIPLTICSIVAIWLWRLPHTVASVPHREAAADD